MHGKIAEVILYLYKNIYNEQNPYPFIISRQDFADMAAISKESVSRILKQFKDDNLIKINIKTIKILNYDQLVQISECG